MPKAWTQPVVNSVILPVHAQTTTDEGEGLPGEEPPKPDPLPTLFRDDIPFTGGDRTGDRRLPGAKDILSLLISDAQAGYLPVSSGDLMIDSPDGINFTAKCNLFAFKSVLTMTASGTVNGAPADLIVPACGAAVIGTISVTTIAASGAPYSIALTELSNEISGGILPEGPGEPVSSGACPIF